MQKEKKPARGHATVIDLDLELGNELENEIELRLEPESILIPLRLVRDSGVPPMAKLMYGVLGSFYVGKQKFCSPSMVEIAERSGVTLPNVPRSIRNLEHAGYVRIVRDERKRNKYELVK